MTDVKHFIFFDFEMLCSNRGMTFEDMEAIRLGAVKYDLETKSISYFDQFIRPENQQPLSSFCKKLTGIQDDDLAEANDFKVVFEQFLTWVGGVKKARYFSWSTSDLTRLKLDADRHAIAPRTITKIEKRYIDFQAIFKRRVSKDPLSVENALQLYGLSFVGEKHHPAFDAYNTLLIYLSFLNEPVQSDLAMLKQFFFDDVPQTIEAINKRVRDQLKEDALTITSQTQEVYRLRDAKKMVKPIRRIVERYENIQLNRSGIFTKENVVSANQLINFYEDFLHSCDKHEHYSSNILIVDEYMVRPLKQLSLKQR